MPFLVETAAGELILSLHVQPKSSRCGFSGIYDDTLKLALTSPPVDGKANTQALGYLAKLLGLPKSNLTLISGQQGRRKKIRISGISPDLARRILEEAAGV
ncbi:MAG: DUF167 domain-containing protein [Proteobacteria bacterium]|nr:DUF167 domain-containing protein [Pseudomonadota bacterium]MBU1686282.1 DUF167 domain-containing protein [Pseudomonadota bacterium]